MKPTKELTNTALLDRLARLTRKSGELESQLIEHLAEFVHRELHLTLGLRTVYAYATTVLGFSRDAAQKRIRAAKAVLKQPLALDHLRSGALTVSSLAALAPAIELPGLLDYALGRSKREVEQRVALLRRQAAPRGAALAHTRADPGPVSYELSPELSQKLAIAARLLRNASGDREDPNVEHILEHALDALISALSDDVENDSRTSSEHEEVGQVAVGGPLRTEHHDPTTAQQLLTRVAAWARRQARFAARRARSPGTADDARTRGPDRPPPRAWPVKGAT